VPLILSTTTGLISPQFHTVFDDKFTTTNYLKSNELPTDWSTLLDFSQAKFVDDDFSLDPFIDPLWFNETSPTTTIDTTSNTITNSTLSSSQREPDIGSLSFSLQREPIIGSPSTSSQRELDISSTANDSSYSPSTDQPVSVPPGWNPSHNYNTRFHRRTMANFASISPDDTTSIDPHYMQLF
jgi:hypothetical protein